MTVKVFCVFKARMDTYSPDRVDVSKSARAC